jgi:hypothetical protein
LRESVAEAWEWQRTSGPPEASRSPLGELPGLPADLEARLLAGR